MSKDDKFDFIRYFDWLDPVSIKVGCMFKKDGKQMSKAISNAKESEDESRKLFNLLMEALINKYGPNKTKNSFMGVTQYGWSGTGGTVVMLQREKEKTRLVIMTFK